MSYFDPTVANAVDGSATAASYSRVQAQIPATATLRSATYFKNFGPRLGAAYSLDSKTVLRASYGVMFTHGNAVGGSATSLERWASRPRHPLPPTNLVSQSFPASGAFPAYTPAQGRASGPTFGTGFTTTTAGFTATPSGMGFADTISGQPCSRVHQLHPRHPAPVDQLVYFDHDLRRVAGPLPSRGRQQRSRLLRRPARSEVSFPGCAIERHRHYSNNLDIGLRHLQSTVPRGLPRFSAALRCPEAIPLPGRQRHLRLRGELLLQRSAGFTEHARHRMV